MSLVERKWASGPVDEYLPYPETDDGVPPMARPGDGYRCHITGLTHWENGFPTQDPEKVDRMMRRILGKLDRHRDVIEAYEALECEDADVVVVGFGITSRAARRAVKAARQRGINAGLFRPITLWPFPEDPFKLAAGRAASIIVAEMNAGQLNLEVERLCAGRARLSAVNRIDGEPIEPQDILDKIEEVTKDG